MCPDDARPLPEGSAVNSVTGVISLPTGWRMGTESLLVQGPGAALRGSGNVHHSFHLLTFSWKGFPGGSAVKNPSVNAGDLGSIPGSGRSLGEEKIGNPLQHSCLGNSMDRGGWQARVDGVAKRVRHNLETTTISHSKK